MAGYTKEQIKSLVEDNFTCECKTCKKFKCITKFPRKLNVKNNKYYYERRCENCRYKHKVKNYNILDYAKAYKEKVESTVEGRASLMRNRCKQRAKKYGYEFDLDKDLIINKLKKGVCEATNIPLVISNLDYNPYAPSIDRINSNKGYTNDNIQVTSMIYNFCKNKFTSEQVNDFINKLKNI